MSKYTTERIAKERELIKSDRTLDVCAYEIRHPDKYPHSIMSYSGWGAALDEIERLQAENALLRNRFTKILEHFEHEAREGDGILEEYWQDYEDAREILGLNRSDDSETEVLEGAK